MYNLKTLETLSKISLSEEERDMAADFFDFWLPKFDMLDTIEIKNIEPLFRVSSLENVMREDESHKTANVDELLENAPEQYDNYFVVPRVL
jgi:aspartyl-tRNA(Asn)/glutamyl-tRNA(Gln) amidotransferase subunit C